MKQMNTCQLLCLFFFIQFVYDALRCHTMPRSVLGKQQQLWEAPAGPGHFGPSAFAVAVATACDDRGRGSQTDPCRYSKTKVSWILEATQSYVNLLPDLMKGLVW